MARSIFVYMVEPYYQRGDAVEPGEQFHIKATSTDGAITEARAFAAGKDAVSFTIRDEKRRIVYQSGRDWRTQ